MPSNQISHERELPERERARLFLGRVLDDVGAFDHSNDEARDRHYVEQQLAAEFEKVHREAFNQGALAGMKLTRTNEP